MPSWSQLCAAQVVHAGTPPGPVIRCGLMDTLLADLPVSMVFGYDGPLDEERLADGLAVALRRVPAFAGRLRSAPDGLWIECVDAGVPLTVVDVDDPLEELVGRVTLPSSGLVEHLDAAGARGGGRPLLTVQLARLAGGATMVGCSFHHAAGDMNSILLFMRAWSAAVEGTPQPEVSIVEDRDAYLDAHLPPHDCGRPGLRLPGPGEAAALRREIETALRVNRTVQVYLSAAEVARMRHAYGLAAGRRLSTGDVLSAHLISALRQLDGDPQARDAALTVNLRRRFGLPDGLVGNMLGEICLPYPPDSPPAALASAIRAAIEDFPGTHLSFRANRAFLGRIGRARLDECAHLGFDPARKTLAFSSLAGFGVYDIRFAGRRPAFFSIVPSMPLPWVSWLVEGFGGQGYLFTASLPSRLAARLRGADGYAALHRFREPADPVPALAAAHRKLA